MAISGRRLAASVALGTLLTAGGAFAARPFGEDAPRLSAGKPGAIVNAPRGDGEAELLAFDPGLAPALAALAPEDGLVVEEFPVAPGVRRSVRLTRHEIYAPDARIFRVEGRRTTEIPRSSLIFLWGDDLDGRDRIFVSIDPLSGELRGLSSGTEGLHEIVPQRADPKGRYLVARPETFVDGPAPRWSCAQEGGALATLATVPNRAFSRTASLITTLHTATVAIDTDNELMAQKFSDSTTAATNYIASLIASINVMYERDLLLRLLQGTTYLRVSSTSDPYSQGPDGSGSVSFAELDEFGDYWSGNYGSVPRALAAMLSGKSPSPYSASGIAWYSPTPLCSKSVGYSFSQVFKISYLAGDTLVVGHEIGHNLSSPHTHCYSPAVDLCFTECYSGTPSCPSPLVINGYNATGTLMSYCHLSPCNSSTTFAFHPRTVSEYAGPAIQNAVGSCVFPLVTQPVVSSISPNSGSTLGGTPVTIVGASFVGGATVTIGGVPATGVSVVNSNTITATTGPHATGTVDVVVTNPNLEAGTLPIGFFYVPPPTGSRYHTLTPCRVVDTRNPNGSLGGPVLDPSSVRTFVIAGACGLPASARAVSVTLAVVAAGSGHFRIYPGNGTDPGNSAINFSAGQIRSNNAVLMLSTDGLGSLKVANGSGGSNHLILDVNGYFE